MRNFKDVYNDNKSKVDENLKIVADKERVELLAAIREEYGVKNFNSLSESEKSQFKKLINEMWNPNTGLNERGRLLVNESKMTLSSESTPEQVQKFFSKAIKNDIGNFLLWLASDGVNGQSPIKVKKDIEAQVGKKIDSKVLKNMLFEILCGYLKTKIGKTKFNA